MIRTRHRDGPEPELSGVGRLGPAMTDAHVMAACLAEVGRVDLAEQWIDDPEWTPRTETDRDVIARARAVALGPVP